MKKKYIHSSRTLIRKIIGEIRIYYAYTSTLTEENEKRKCIPHSKIYAFKHDINRKDIGGIHIYHSDTSILTGKKTKRETAYAIPP